MEYDIETTGFMLPVLTVQPLLENAVKHGVSQTGHGGTVMLSVVNSTILQKRINGGSAEN